jgi:large subunit ribosomal protein L29
VKLEDIRGLPTEDLRKQCDEAREQLFKLRYAAMSESVENSKNIRETRRRVARMKTVLRERELAGKSE